MRKFSFLMSLFLFGFISNAQIIRSVLFNPPGTDDGKEYVEVFHTASTALTNVWLLEIDGDGVNGNINSAINLSSYSTGSNGLLLIRDNTSVINPAPSAATNVVVFNFTPDLQNGTSTFALVTNFTGAIGDDLDVNNDGTLNNTPWTTALSAVSVSDGGATDDQYADDLGGVNLPDITTFLAGGIVLYSGTYYAVDVSGTSPGPYAVDAAWDASGTRSSAVELLNLTPGNTSSPLPISLISFSGYKVGRNNKLHWITASESNNRDFAIQRSLDGINYTTIGIVNSLAIGGNSNADLFYTYTDNMTGTAKQYYRLLQTDLNNTSKYSNIIVVKGEKAPTLSVDGLYPNPAGNYINLAINTPAKNKVTISVINISGKILNSQIAILEPGVNTVQLTTNRLASGNYLVRIIDETGISITSRMMKN
jgi:Secretion system C-terminal sorting domain